MRSDLGPISVSAPGTSLTTAQGQHITFNTRDPFAKLDSTNVNSFEVITILFNTEPPNPSPPLGQTGTLRSLIYQYPHGYSYTPSTWFLVSKDNFVTVLGSEGVWILGNASGISPDIAKFEVDVDSTNINFYINKQWTNDGINGPPNIIGYFLTIRAYIFVGDLTATDVPASA